MSEDRHTRREFLLYSFGTVLSTPLAFHSLRRRSPVIPDTHPASPTPSSSSIPPPPIPSVSLQLGTIFDTAIGSFLPPRPERLLGRRIGHLSHRAVVVAESHLDAQHHSVQYRVVQALRRYTQGRLHQSDAPLAIGLEHFYRQHQRFLDQYVDGSISLEQLLAATRFEQTFGYDARLWQPIWEFAREHRIPLVGLNAPFELMQLIAHYGLEQLPSRLYEVLPPDMQVHGNRAHRERFMRAMRAMGVDAHGEAANDPDALQRMYESQVVWDEYMSESAALWLQRHPTACMCVLAGTGHVEGRTGLPDRLARRSGSPAFTIVPYTVPFQSNGLPDIEQPGGREQADWLWYVPQREELEESASARYRAPSAAPGWVRWV